jgi:hypothetical protein
MKAPCAFIKLKEIEKEKGLTYTLFKLKKAAIFDGSLLLEKEKKIYKLMCYS